MKCQLAKYKTYDEEGCKYICDRCRKSELSLKSFIEWMKNIRKGLY
jgi:hypothetical protein